MNFLPILERELRQASRKRSTYLTRILVSGVAAFFAALLLLTLRWGPSRFVGATFFRVLFFISFFYCLWEGGRNTADCISEEKRTGTLGFLFLTDLRGFDVVLGKLAAASTRAFHGLLGFFPVLSMSLVLGGITLGEFWRAVLVLMNTFAFGLTVGLFVSSLVRSGGAALMATFGTLIAGNVLPFVFGPTLKGQILSIWSPAVGARFLWEPQYQRHTAVFWISQGLVLASSFLFLGLTSAFIGRAWREKTISLGRTRMRPSGDAQKRLRETHPVCWFSTQGTSPHIRKLFYATIVIVSVTIGVFSHGNPANIGAPIILAWGLKLWVAFEASFHLAEARRTGSIELLATTPLNSLELSQGYCQGLVRLFRGPTLALIGYYLFLESIARFSSTETPFWRETLFTFTALLWTLQLILDLFAIGLVGLWSGLTAAKPMSAFGKVVLLAMILPLVAVCVPNLIIDLGVIALTRPKLQKNFRRLMIGGAPPAQGLVPWPPTSGHGMPPVFVAR